MRRGYLCHGCGLRYERPGDARACESIHRQERRRRRRYWPWKPPTPPGEYRGWGWRR